MRVHVTVLTRDGAPIADACVTAGSSLLREEVVAHTAADGTCELSLIPGCEQLEVTHENYCRAWKNIDLREPTLSPELVLVPGATIRGHVIARDTGTPLAHASVYASAGGDFAVAEADDDGAFILRGLHEGVASIGARGRGYASTDSILVEIDEGEHVEQIRLAVDPAFSISGRVVLHNDPNECIAGAELSTRSLRDGGIPASAVSDAVGNFEIHGLAPGRYHVMADKAGMLREAGMTIEIVDRNVAELSFHMRCGATLSGRVDPPAVAQIGLALVGVDPFTNMLEANLARARTQSDAGGVFVVRDVPSGEYELCAMAADGNSGSVPVAVGDDNQTDLVIRTSPRISVGGRVIDFDGNPLAGYYVFPSQIDVPLKKRFRRDNIYRGATTATDGSFKVVGLEAGRYQLTVQPGSGPGSKAIEVDLTDGERTDVMITLEVSKAKILGQVVGLDNKPAAGMLVRAAPVILEASGQNAVHGGHARTDRRGNFVIESVPAGTYALVVHDPRFNICAEVRELKTDDPTTIVLARLGSLTINVSHEGAPARDITLVCRRGEYVYDAQDVRGTHTFTDLHPGDYQCEAFGPEGVATGTVSIDGDHPTLDLALGDYAAISGVVVNVLTGQPVAGMCVSARGASELTDETGHFIIERVSPGNGQLSITPQHLLGYGFESCAYSAKPGERVDVGQIKLLAPRTGQPGTFGLTLEVRGNTLRVARIKKGTPAERAAIVVGDEITTVEGHAVADFGVKRAQRLLASDNVDIGQTVTVVLASGTSATMTSVRW